MSSSRSTAATSVRRVGLGVVDQALSSISNVLFLVAVARVAGVEEFGAVSFAYAVFAFGLTVQRAALGTLISLSSGAGVSPPLLASLAWALVVVGIGLGLGSVVDGVGGVAAYYVVIAACVVVYPQDLLRYSAIAEKRAGLAVVSDGAWVLVTSVLLALGSLGVAATVTEMTLVWLVLGAGSALASIAWGLRGTLSWRDPWLRRHASELRVLGPEALLASVAPLVLALVLARYLSLGDVAAVRGAGTLLGPAAMLFSALPVVLLPEMARLLGEDRLRLATAQAAVMGVLVLGWGGLLALLPTALGEQLLGETWAGSRAVLLWPVLELVMWALASGPIALLGTLRRWRTLLLARGTYLGLVAVSLGVTVPSGDVGRVTAGMAVAAAVNAVVLVLAARRQLARSPLGYAR